MNADLLKKREEAMERFLAAKAQKKQRIAEITKSLCEEYKARTGKEPKHINVW